MIFTKKPSAKQCMLDTLKKLNALTICSFYEKSSQKKSCNYILVQGFFWHRGAVEDYTFCSYLG